MAWNEDPLFEYPVTEYTDVTNWFIPLMLLLVSSSSNKNRNSFQVIFIWCPCNDPSPTPSPCPFKCQNAIPIVSRIATIYGFSYILDLLKRQSTLTLPNSQQTEWLEQLNSHTDWTSFQLLSVGTSQKSHKQHKVHFMSMSMSTVDV